MYIFFLVVHAGYNIYLNILDSYLDLCYVGLQTCNTVKSIMWLGEQDMIFVREGYVLLCEQNLCGCESMICGVVRTGYVLFCRQDMCWYEIRQCMVVIAGFLWLWEKDMCGYENRTCVGVRTKYMWLWQNMCIFLRQDIRALDGPLKVKQNYQS